MKYKVAIIDDEQTYLDFISTQIKEFPTKEDISFQVDCFLTGDAFLNQEHLNYDIIFLDINMPGINGLTTATRFRAVNQSSLIIFSTHYAQYAIDGYMVNAFAFLIKPISTDTFQSTLKKALQRIQKNTPSIETIQIKTSEGIHVVDINDIVYIEIQRHTLFYYILKNNELTTLHTYGSMKEISNALRPMNFETCSACYLINLKHVSAIIKKKVELCSKITLPISRQFFKNFLARFMEFLKESGTKNA